jgi:DNA helicase-2/ATP-dependent DNA helicase PcrA
LDYFGAVVTMPWHDGLIPEQIQAASFSGSHARLLAGPGTGKTLSLTRRILYLIEKLEISPNQITALTFTRAATAELKERVKKALGDDDDIPNISTLHSFSLKTILKNPSKTRLPQPIRIADDFEERYIIEEEIKEIIKAKKIKDVKDLFNRLSADWEELSVDNDLWEKNFPNPQFLGAWDEHRRIYGYTLRSELVYQLKLALEEEDLDLGYPMSHLLVDEYQDLNPCDLAIIKYLTDIGAELYCAGDDDQSIYGFRRASPEGIRKFPQEYKPSKSLELNTCMRCDKEILDFSMHVARQDPRREEKFLKCREKSEKGEVQILRFNNHVNEAEGIAILCEWLINFKHIDTSKILILIRSDRKGIFSKVIYGALHDRHIPVQIASNPLASLDTPEGRQFICFLHLLINRQDHLAWRVLLQLRKNGIGDLTLKRLYDLARMHNITFSDSIDMVMNDPNLVQKNGKLIQKDISEINSILDPVELNSIEDISNFIQDFANKIIEDKKIRTNIISLFQRIIDLTGETNLEKLLRAINISIGNEEQDIQKDNVSIMTMHQAKGLSADAVFIAAAEDEYIPGRTDNIGDERRLLYVSLTRARHYLFITHSNIRTGQQMHSGRESGQPRRRLSRFLTGGPVRSVPGTNYIEKLIQ